LRCGAVSHASDRRRDCPPHPDEEIDKELLFGRIKHRQQAIVKSVGPQAILMRALGNVGFGSLLPDRSSSADDRFRRFVAAGPRRPNSEKI
jgi:hypothetical protein